MTIVLQDICGTFAENKDQARKMRGKKLEPALKKKEGDFYFYPRGFFLPRPSFYAFFYVFFKKKKEKGQEVV